ncbi:hypothetical protein HNR62_000295 [Oceanisphaera litoralis]|uniref:hypothetical protein n=1 Tax=Oceanisphaera litoralis TaxID=225144 RepID=UPI00195ABBA6|nr:hypothetical protein [Oceanisphaera litoralis]MBM7454466.1 hypothetical protein [Oceanisphaera litoralis]
MSVLAAVAGLTLPWVPDALETLHETQSRLALSEFLRQSLVLRRRLVLPVSDADQVTLGLVVQGLSPVRLLYVTLDGHPQDLSGMALEGDTLLLHGVTSGELVVEVAVTTSPTKGDVAEAELEPWLEPLMHGTLARLFALQPYEWYDPNQASFHRSAFYAGIEQARADDLRQAKRRPRRVRYAGL